MRKAFVMLAVVVGVSGCASTGGMFGKHTPKPLHPDGVRADSPARIRMVTGSDTSLNEGDTVLSINGKPVKSFSYYNAVSSTGEMTVKSAGGTVRKVALSQLFSDDGKTLEAHTLSRGGVFIFPQQVPAYQRTQDAALLYLGAEKGLVSASMWQTKPRILELRVDLRAEPNCQTCSLKALAVMDGSRKAWLSAIPYNKAAWLVYTPAGRAPPMMNVPPPTPVAYTSTTTGSGTVSGSMYGNAYSGNYSGMSTTTTTPQYNYTGTEMAEAYNLGALLKQERIESDNKHRRDFVANRVGNLRVGRMPAGQQMTGYVDFVVPNDFKGPYVVAIKGNKHFAAARFEAQD
ncbi:hypothetical protein ACS8YF_12585 [Salinisphaera sp. SWV1]|uniref:hypothetical protein n=1 Tax=Salinisphaera sp. SWV1 TaxID=3454139 RepID=UPI003F85FC20